MVNTRKELMRAYRSIWYRISVIVAFTRRGLHETLIIKSEMGL